MTVKTLAAWLDIPTSTIYQWRYLGKGPRAYKIEGRVRYRRSDVEAWLESCADKNGPPT